MWYSNQPADTQPDRRVHNVSALTVAVMSRLQELGVKSDPDLNYRLVEFLHSEQGSPWDTPESADSSNWPYGVDGKRANDLIHETFILEGLGWYENLSDPVSEAVDGILRVHFDSAGAPSSSVHTLGSLGWGPPAGLYILTGIPGYEAQTGAIASELLASVDDAGKSSLVPDDNPRALAWYALALARYSANQAGETQLLPWSR